MLIPKTVDYPSIYYTKLQGTICSQKLLIKCIKENVNEKNITLLDYGCGINTDLFGIIKNIDASKGIGVDLKKNMIKINNIVKKYNKMNNIIFEVNKNKYKLRFPNNFFNVVISGHVIEHVDKPKLLIKEIHRLLKPDGVLILGTPYKYHKKIWSLANLFKFNISAPDHIVEGYTKKELTKLLSKKFEIKKLEYDAVFTIRFFYDLTKLFMILYRKKLKIKKEEVSLCENIIDEHNVEFKKTLKYYFFFLLGVLTIFLYAIDNLILKIIPLKGYNILLVAKAIK